MDKAARKKLNLKAIKRYDAAIVNILDQSPHAALYHFSNERREWVKKSVEGVLFLVQRNAPPYFAVYIMNRLAMENYTLYLTDFDDMDLQENFIIYSTSDGERYAFWLYEEGDRQRLLNKITTLHDGIQKELSAKTNQKRTNMNMPVPPPPANANAQQLPPPSSSTTTSSSTSSSGKAAPDLLAMLQSGMLPPPPPPPPLSNTTSTTTNATTTTSAPRHHHPPNEYGPERIEQLQQQQQQQQAMMHHHHHHQSSPAMLPTFADLPRMHWNTPPSSSSATASGNDPALEFSLPDSELMQPQSQHDPNSGQRLLELLKNSKGSTRLNQIEQPQQQPLQQQKQPSSGEDTNDNNGNRLWDLLTNSKGTTVTRMNQIEQPQQQSLQQQKQSSSGEDTNNNNNSNRLYDLFKRAAIEDKTDTMYLSSPPLPPASLGYSQPTSTTTPHPSGSSSTPNTNTAAAPPPHILFGKELTKPYQPTGSASSSTMRTHSHPPPPPSAASPRNSASLLQALQGGTVGHHHHHHQQQQQQQHQHPHGTMMMNGNASSSSPNMVHATQPLLSSSSSSSLAALHGSPLSAPSTVPATTTMTLESELHRRLPSRPLSKPEFMHHFFDLIQTDPSFLDAIYDNYYKSRSKLHHSSAVDH